MTGWVHLTTVDYIMIGLLILAFLEGFHRGFLAEVLRFGALVVTLLLAGRYNEPFRLWLNQRLQLEQRLFDFLAGRLGLPPEAYQPGGATSSAHVADWLRRLSLPGPLREELLYQATMWQPEEATASPAYLITQELAETLAEALSYVILLALLGLLVAVAAGLLSHLVHQDSILNTVNRVAGGTVNALGAAVVLTLVASLVAPALAVIGFPWLQEQLASAVLTPYGYRLYDWLWSAVFGSGGGFFFQV